MLVHYRQYYTSDTERIQGFIGDRWLAKDRAWGIELHATSGRSKYGRAHQYYVFAPEWFVSRYHDYSEWRIGFKAFTDKEAIDNANSDKRVAALYRRMWAREMNVLMAMG